MLENKNRILIIEDKMKVFIKHKAAFEELGYKVFPEKYEKFHQKSTGIKSFQEFFNKITRFITSNHIDILSLDLQLSKFGYDFLKDDSNTADENLGGIKIIEKLSQSCYHHIRTLPIIVISKFNKGDIEKINSNSKYIVKYIKKSSLDNKDDNKNEYPLKAYIESVNLDEEINLEIEKYNRFNFLEFKSLYGENESYFNNEEAKIKKREVTKEFLKEKKIALVNAIYGFQEHEIIPHYQGIYNQKKEILKYESLARVVIKEQVESFFIYDNVAIFYGLISDVTTAVIATSFKKINNTNKKISINIPYEDLKESNFELFKAYLEKIKEENALQANQITLEILEGVKQENDIVISIKELSALGYKIAIDDFGIENSNFLRLKELIDEDCIDFIKIDGEFIKGMTNINTEFIIVKSIVNLIKEHNKREDKKNIKVVAEYVKDAEIFRLCTEELEIDMLQGFYLNEPSADMPD